MCCTVPHTGSYSGYVQKGKDLVVNTSLLGKCLVVGTARYFYLGCSPPQSLARWSVLGSMWEPEVLQSLTFDIILCRLHQQVFTEKHHNTLHA